VSSPLTGGSDGVVAAAGAEAVDSFGGLAPSKARTVYVYRVAGIRLLSTWLVTVTVAIGVTPPSRNTR
jgi:hypothetical protein